MYTDPSACTREMLIRDRDSHSIEILGLPLLTLLTLLLIRFCLS